jgi:dTMP kinase
LSLGALIIFEGPDGVGKSALAEAFRSRVAADGFNVELLSFPGKEEGTLGKLVYELHHDPQHFRLTSITPASLQVLHIAAHVDAIERRIIPSIQSGQIVVLDRFWWSTYVYGTVSKVSPQVLRPMIATEKAVWGATTPAILFLIDRSTPLRPEPVGTWTMWRKEYRTLYEAEKTDYPCAMVSNDGDIDETTRALFQLSRTHLPDAPPKGSRP